MPKSQFKSKSKTVDYSKKSKESLIKDIVKLEISKKTGWWSYFQSNETLENTIRKHHEKLKNLEKELSSHQLKTSELVLPDYIIKLINQNSTTFECPCCKEDLELAEKNSYIVTVCGHFFCKSCFEKWTETNYTCPTCRGKVVKTLRKKWENQ